MTLIAISFENKLTMGYNNQLPKLKKKMQLYLSNLSKYTRRTELANIFCSQFFVNNF
jgi:hypothetical protein